MEQGEDRPKEGSSQDKSSTQDKPKDLKDPGSRPEGQEGVGGEGAQGDGENKSKPPPLASKPPRISARKKSVGAEDAGADGGGSGEGAMVVADASAADALREDTAGDQDGTCGVEDKASRVQRKAKRKRAGKDAHESPVESNAGVAVNGAEGVGRGQDADDAAGAQAADEQHSSATDAEQVDGEEAGQAVKEGDDVGDEGPAKKRSKTMAADDEVDRAPTGAAMDDELEAQGEQDDQDSADRLDEQDELDKAQGDDKLASVSKGDSEDGACAGILPQHDPSRPLPAWALDPASNEITEEEKLAVPEFFCGRPIKTPDRYLGIRKHLQKLWEQHKPRYLKKSSCLGIKGDVNAIGRVHAYMETIGVINVGHQLAPPPARPYHLPSSSKPAKPAAPRRDAQGIKGKVAKEKAKDSKDKEKQKVAPEAQAAVQQDKEKHALLAARDKDEQEEALRRRFSNVLPVSARTRTPMARAASEIRAFAFFSVCRPVLQCSLQGAWRARPACLLLVCATRAGRARRTCHSHCCAARKRVARCSDVMTCMLASRKMTSPTPPLTRSDAKRR